MKKIMIMCLMALVTMGAYAHHRGGFHGGPHFGHRGGYHGGYHHRMPPPPRAYYGGYGYGYRGYYCPPPRPYYYNGYYAPAYVPAPVVAPAPVVITPTPVTYYTY